jgi:hypothetical protein
MEKKNITSKIGIILAAGSLWGLVEFGAGMGLQKCAVLFTGAVLTGLSFFWLSFIWSMTRRILPVMIIALVAMMFKWLDAWLLHVAWNHGSVLNPMFAFFTALAGFMILTGILRKRFSQHLTYRILAGGGAALIATSLFPLVKFVTASPACTFAATNIPLVLYTAPVAILLSMATVPLGFGAALWYNRIKQDRSSFQPYSVLFRILSPLVFIGSVLIIVLVRII